MAPPNGQPMAWHGARYHYNLSANPSQQQVRGSLSGGAYRVVVSHVSFQAPVGADIDLRR